jgi:dinuclear metal center YbgI/SA1388 family protein
MKIKELIEFTETFAPLELSKVRGDNSGLLAGDEDDEFSKAILALDITPNVVHEARQKGAELIISHHPVIFKPLTHLEPATPPYMLARHGIDALCLHLCLDLASDCGVNICLAQHLGLQNIKMQPDEYLAIGELATPLLPAQFAALVKEKLGLPFAKYSPGWQYYGANVQEKESLNNTKTIKRVAVTGGSGGENIALAAALGADAFVTGEVKHHEWLFAQITNMVVVEGGHYATESVVLEPLAKKLQDRFPGVVFEVSTTEKETHLVI